MSSSMSLHVCQTTRLLSQNFFCLIFFLKQLLTRFLVKKCVLTCGAKQWSEFTPNVLLQWFVFSNCLMSITLPQGDQASWVLDVDFWLPNALFLVRLSFGQDTFCFLFSCSLIQAHLWWAFLPHGWVALIPGMAVLGLCGASEFCGCSDSCFACNKVCGKKATNYLFLMFCQ